MTDSAPQHRRFVTLLQFMQMLSEGKVTANHAKERLDISIRTVYRYLNVLCAAGIEVQQKGNTYWIEKSPMR